MPAIEIAVLKLNSLKRESIDLNTILKKQSILINFRYQLSDRPPAIKIAVSKLKSIKMDYKSQDLVGFNRL